jgi:hypothetical protein
MGERIRGLLRRMRLWSSPGGVMLCALLVFFVLGTAAQVALGSQAEVFFVVRLVLFLMLMFVFVKVM